MFLTGKVWRQITWIHLRINRSYYPPPPPPPRPPPLQISDLSARNNNLIIMFLPRVRSNCLFLGPQLIKFSGYTFQKPMSMPRLRVSMFCTNFRVHYVDLVGGGHCLGRQPFIFAQTFHLLFTLRKCGLESDDLSLCGLEFDGLPSHDLSGGKKKLKTINIVRLRFL